MKWAYGLFEVIDIPPAERSVLLALCWDHTDANGCFPSQQRISDLAGYRVRRVQDLVKSLEAMGLIKRKKVKTSGRFSHTEYALFGSFRVATTGGRGPADHRLICAGGDHRRTGADYRGNIYKGGDPEKSDDVIEFPNRKGAA